MTRARGEGSDSLHALGADLRELAREEISTVRQELAEQARRSGRAVAMLGGAAMMGALAAGSSTTLLIRVLDKFLPSATAAFVATALYGGAAAGLATAGVKELRRTSQALSGETVDTLRRSARAAADEAR